MLSGMSFSRCKRIMLQFCMEISFLPRGLLNCIKTLSVWMLIGPTILGHNYTHNTTVMYLYSSGVDELAVSYGNNFSPKVDFIIDN